MNIDEVKSQKDLLEYWKQHRAPINIVVDDGNIAPGDLLTLFCLEKVTTINHRPSLVDILVEHGFFQSKSQARKAGHSAEPVSGWIDLTIGKKKRRICIWAPTEGD